MHFRGCIKKQYGKHAQALLKSGSEHFYHIHRSLPSQLSWKNSLLLTCQILGLLVNTLATDEKYPVLNRDNLTIPIQMQLSQKHKTFCQFFTAFLKSRWNFEHFDKKDDVHRFCNFEITDSENVVRKMSKEPRFRRPFDKQHGKRAEALWKSTSQHLYYNHWSLPTQYTWKKSLLLTCQILGLLVNTLTADEKYLVLHRDNSRIRIQMEFSKKQKSFSDFLGAILKSWLNFKHFKKKYDPHRFCILEVMDSENVVR